MSFRKIIKRELEVAFSTYSQPIWARILKYVILGIFIYLFHNSIIFWIILSIILILALTLHFWARYKTKGWTQSYGLWKHERDRGI